MLIVALLARMAAGRRDATAEGGSPVAATPRPTEPEPEPEPDEDDAESGEAGEVIAVTSDGYALLPDAHAVRMMPPDEAGDAWKAGDTARNRRGELALAMSFHAGEFTGARIVRGEADEAPWRLEALGREGEYAAFLFETREAADAALGLFESRRVVRLGVDEDGRPAPPSAEQFAEARRVFLETEAALELEDPEE